MTTQILRCAEVCKRTGLSRVTIWRLERTGIFPLRRKLSANAVGWIEAEVEAWIASRDPVRRANTASQKGAS